MSFQPSQYSGAGTSKTSHRRPADLALRSAIARTETRLTKERAGIRLVKAAIHHAARAHTSTAAKRRELHSLEWSLHRDHHLLDVLHRALSPAAQKAALSVEKQANGGAMDPKASGYPAPSTAPPAEKSEAEVVAEAAAEAADPKAADTHDAEAAGTSSGALVPVDAGALVPFYERPIVLVPLGLVTLAGGAWWWKRRKRSSSSGGLHAV